MRSVITGMGLIAMALLTGCASAPAKDSTPTVATEPTAAMASTPVTAPEQANAVDDNEVVCRSEKPLGSRIGKRICKTRAQLEQEEASAREMMNSRDRKSHGVTGTTGGG